MDSHSLKQQLRRELKARRNALAPEEVAQKSEAIAQNWKLHFLNEKIRTLHVFMSMLERKEVDTVPLRQLAERARPEIKLVVPVVDELTDSLRHVWVSPEVELVKSRFGVPEPRGEVKMVSPDEIDQVIVPLLGWDRKGTRLGYGKGHYDRFLASVRPECLKIGVGFACCECDSLPAEGHDVKLDGMITENGVILFEK